MLPSIPQIASSKIQNTSLNFSWSPLTPSQDYEYELKADYKLQ
jgi:hypothetical protein